ncbi:MAG TPA: M20/M25/M40 family metallo-hydrolase [Vicinamibacterales bacterium]|jgi:acetylornithine deacetylase/succinyl-diaminopimelate desuccinylase-like protein
MRTVSYLALTCAVLTALPALAQPRPLQTALADPHVVSAIADVESHTAWTAELLAKLAAIVSPSGHEKQRADAVAAAMREIGLQRVTIDTAPNAVGVIPGRSGRAIVFVSTLDDLGPVAEFQKAAGRPPHVDGARVVGPGTNTSSTTAAMLAAARALVAAGITPEHDLIFAAVAQEETGMVGMKRLYEDYKARAVAFVDVLGDGHSISYGALTIHWWKAVASGPAGHSLNGGVPNVNQGIGRAVDRILQLPQRPDERTVINVAMLQSGAVFNHKPDSGWFSLDVRSLDPAKVEAIETDVRKVLAAVTKETTIAFALEPVQMTPGGQIPGARQSPLVTTSEAIARHLGLTPALNDTGSSNMNVAIAGGTPAIGIGGERGGARAEAGEFADVPAMIRAAKHIVLLAATNGMR